MTSEMVTIRRDDLNAVINMCYEVMGEIDYNDFSKELYGISLKADIALANIETDTLSSEEIVVDTVEIKEPKSPELIGLYKRELYDFYAREITELNVSQLMQIIEAHCSELKGSNETIPIELCGTRSSFEVSCLSLTWSMLNTLPDDSISSLYKSMRSGTLVCFPNI